MIELWNPKQLEEIVSDQKAIDLGQRIRELASQGQEPVGLEIDDFVVIEYQYIPTESIRMVLKANKTSLVLEVFQNQDGVKRTQLFKRKRMVPVIDYVDFKTHKADPGVSTTFG